MITLGPHALLQGDCMDLLDTLETKVDAVITDPPYMIEGASDMGGKINPWCDLLNGSYFYSLFFRKCSEILKETGCIYACLNWRSLASYQKAAYDAGLVIRSLLIWDKAMLGPGMLLRPTYECVALIPMKKFKIRNNSLRDIQRFPWQSVKPHGHPAEKPETLMEWLINSCTDAGDLVLDPMMGSGTTGAAAIKTRRRFIGIEHDPNCFEIAKQRITSGYQTYGVEWDNDAPKARGLDRWGGGP